MKWMNKIIWWLKAKTVGVSGEEVAEYYKNKFPPIDRPKSQIKDELLNCICGKYKDPEIFKCNRCNRLYAFCAECSSFFEGILNAKDLTNFNNNDPKKPGAKCACGYEFEFYFLRNPDYFVTKNDILKAGFESILK